MTASKNATFLLHRDFMEYHSSRFEDYSLMILKKDQLAAILPAHIKEGEVYSHNGLTYGGLICKSRYTTDIDECFQALIDYLKVEKITALSIKVIPSFLQEQYSSALEYLLFQKGASLVSRDMNFVVNLKGEIPFHRTKRKVPDFDNHPTLTLKKTEDLAGFWNQVLIPVLQETYGSAPVHSLEEITLLKERFPGNIVQYNIESDDTILAGITLFIDNGVVKSQYSTVLKEGKEQRVLEQLYLALIHEYKNLGYSYFDFGTTTMEGGSYYNQGLTRYKEEFGSTPMNLDHYRLAL
ncbi:GNAT family N-acetyltransferase [Aureisphaera galaxeae]|uniref:GNAT family N-acetyltransferase n=1 Tax=Aureisphaera galaxeae TaxID=1538023 RepID=UPI002350A22F|nr:GNAT family N-acetyltransferase [Aureisphaera galaxeae]MDC8004456.1 GNAT family N-acetyltransferase [Aureisphaera galaxeae]